MKWLLGWWLVWGAAVCPTHAQSTQEPRLRQLSSGDGLPSDNVNGIAEDHDGYLWFATADGLARYDGVDFRIWRVENGLPDNELWDVHVDAQNRVWVGTDHAGLAMLDVERKRWRSYRVDNTPGMGSDRVWSIQSTPDGAIWFGTLEGGLHRLDAAGRVSRFMPRVGDVRSLPDATVPYLALSPDKQLWIATHKGAARWTGHDFERVAPGALSSQIVNYLVFERDGTLWFSTPEGVGVRKTDGIYVRAPWKRAGISERVFEVLLRDRAGQYWLDTPGGIALERDGKLQRVPLLSVQTQGVVYPVLTDVHEDSEGGVWLASSGHGLWYLPGDWRQFAVLGRPVGGRTSLGNEEINSVAPASIGGLWLVGSAAVLERLDLETGRTKPVRTPTSNSEATSVLEDRAGNVWVGYRRHVVRVDAATGSPRAWAMEDARDPAIADNDYVAQTADGLVWFANASGHLQARDRAGRVTQTLSPGDGRGLPEAVSVDMIGTGPDGQLWLSGTRGVWRWNPGARRLDPVPGAPAHATAAFTHSGRAVWLASSGRIECYEWDGRRLVKSAPDIREGVPQVRPSGMVAGRNGALWLTSIRGLLRVDPSRRSVRLYGTADGLPSQALSTPPVLAHDGRIAVGSAQGLILFDPATVTPGRHTARVSVERVDVRRGDRTLTFDPARTFALEHDDRDLRVVVRLLSFNDARHHAYRFFLRGYDADWVDVGASGERLFAQLRPGQYALDLSARTADDVWSPVHTLRFSVTPPWWRTWPAMVAFVALAATVSWWAALAYRRRIRRRDAWKLARREREMAEQASLAKTRFLATLGHEVRTPMTGVLGMSELLLQTALQPQQRGYVDSIRRAGRHLLRLLNDALDLARIESGRLELIDEPFALHGVVTDATSLIGPLAQERGLGFHVEIAPDVPTHLCGDGSRLFQILLNLLGNAVKFTERGEVRLRVSNLAPLGVRLDVEDTGPGLTQEQCLRLFRRFEQADGVRTAARYGGSGLGLAICDELAVAMGGSIRVESVRGKGAHFIVELPLRAVDAAPPSRDANAPVQASVMPLTLLLVEDDPIVAVTVSGLLQAQGHRVTHAPHGLAALVEVNLSSFDAALLDLDLPGMDGIALAAQLRAQGFSGPMFAVTARADADAEPQAMAAGFHGFLRKPVTGAMLAGLLEGVPRREAAAVD